MITQELLEEAKRRFPIGCKYIPAPDIKSINPSYYEIKGDEFQEWSLKSDSIHERNSQGLVYCQGVWGKVINQEYQPLIFN